MTPEEIRELVAESEQYFGPIVSGFCPECRMECDESDLEPGLHICAGCGAEWYESDLTGDPADEEDPTEEDAQPDASEAEAAVPDEVQPKDTTLEVGDVVVPIGQRGAGYVLNITRGRVTVEFDHSHTVKYAPSELRKVGGRNG